MKLPGQVTGILDECPINYDDEFTHIYGILIALHLIQYVITHKMFNNIENMKTFQKKFLGTGTFFIITDVIILAVIAPDLMEKTECSSLIRNHLYVDLVIAILKVPNVYLERILADKKVIQIANYVVDTLHLRDVKPLATEENEVEENPGLPLGF